MKTPINNDNTHKVGSIVIAHEYPQQKLLIVDYKDRIYYCEPVESQQKRTLAYFAREIKAMA